MGGGKTERIEAVVDRGAAALLAGATAYGFFGLMGGVYREPQLGILCLSVAVIAFLVCARALRAIPVEERFDLPEFDLPAIDSFDGDELVLTEADQICQDELLLTEADRVRQNELLLTDADRLRPAEAGASDELMLDDILAELGSDSRVVRLFDPTAMPSPGQLKARIERHLGEESAPAASSDASEALYDALAELRRSLR